jgi:hypothetical protein
MATDVIDTGKVLTKEYQTSIKYPFDVNAPETDFPALLAHGNEVDTSYLRKMSTDQESVEL